MTLREKLKPSTSINTQGEAGRFADESIILVNEFAIDFVEWCDENYFRIGTTSFWAESLWDEKAITYKTEELLKIYESNNRI